MKDVTLTRWVELKKNTRVFESIMQNRRILNRAKCKDYDAWDDMSVFFREADKYIK